MTETEQSMLYWAERAHEAIKNPPAGTDGENIKSEKILNVFSAIIARK